MKNLTIFKTEPGWKPDTEKMPLSIPNQTGIAWLPLRDGLPMIEVGGNVMMCAEIQEKKVPSSVLKRETTLRCEQLAQSTGDIYYLKSKKKRKEVEETVWNELYVRAFVSSKQVYVWLDTVNGYLCVGTNSLGIVDSIVTLMIKSKFNSFKGISTKYLPSGAMRNLLLSDDQIDGKFSVGQSCELFNPEASERTIKFKNETLDTPSLRKHITDGREVRKLELNYDLKILFTLNNNRTLTGIKILEEIKDAEEYESAEAKFDADFAIMTGMYSELIGALVDALGGEA